MTVDFNETDREHLRLLSLFHYILGSLAAAMALLPLIYVFVGIFIMGGGLPEAQGEAMFLGGILIVFGLAFCTIQGAISICVILSGRHLARQTSYTFSFIVACIECLSVPIGTILGIFTIVVLSRPSVKAVYEEKKALAR